MWLSPIVILKFWGYILFSVTKIQKKILRKKFLKLFLYFDLRFCEHFFHILTIYYKTINYKCEKYCIFLLNTGSFINT
jgi:hypothetical protein